MTKSLYNIREEYANITAELLENGGELTPEMEMALLISKEDLQNKAVAYGLRIREFTSQFNAISEESERLANRAKAYKKTCDRMKELISSAMEQFQVDKIEDPLVTLSFRKSKSVEIMDDTQVPADYWVTKPSEISKSLISDALKQGTEVPGAMLVEKKNLQIK
ncbi:MAG TPA: siphovirus Gp157 family protein [Chitinophagaceae bacterium]